MNARTSFLKRCLALALALVLLLSSANTGVLQAFAAGESVSVREGEIVAENYALTAAEKNLLKSKYVVGDTVTYTVPADSDNLIAVDTDAKTIEADDYEGWKPTVAKIMVGTEEKETVALTDGKGNYTYGGNAFAVKVEYVLNKTVAESRQGTLLNTGKWLKDGVANAKAAADQAGNLLILEKAMPELVNLANNGVQAGKYKVTLNENCVKSIKTLNSQMTANNGVLDLSKQIKTYNAAESKVKYILTEGKGMKSDVDALVEKVEVVKAGVEDLYDNAASGLAWGIIDQATYDALGTLLERVSDLYNGLKPVSDAEWIAAQKGTALVKSGVGAGGYKALDNLVAKLGKISSVAVKNPLKVAEATVQYNLAMYNVNIEVALNVVKDNAVVEHGAKTTTVTLAENATAAEILAAVEETGIEADALAAWADVYVAEHFEPSASDLPATLIADTTYTITYSPKEYTFDIAGDVKGYPYGYVVTLPAHENPEKSYDYYDAGGNYYPQNSEILVDKDMTFTRTSGKAYTTGKLLAILANNYAGDNAKVNAILNSGALNVDETINYRKPTTEELETLVTLNGNKLTAKTYPSSYNGLSWAPDTYEVDGVSHDFNGETVTIAGEFDEVHVYYSLVLTNYTKADVKDIFDLVVELNAEAAGQKSVLDRLAGYGEQMSILDMTTMQGLQAMVKNEEMKAIIGEMMDAKTGVFDAEGTLILNKIIAAYNDANSGGLYYYYTNDAFVRGEVDKLSGFMKRLLGKDEYKSEIETLLGNMGQGDKADKLDDLTGKLEEVSKDLSPKNAAIVTSDAGALRKLADALAMEGEVAVAEYDSPYISMEPIVRVAEKYAAVTVSVTVNGVSNTTPITAKVLKGEKLSAAQVAELKTAVNAFVAGTGIKTKYYNTNYDAAVLDALTATGLEANVTYEFEWTKATYAVNVPGADTQYVDIDNLTFNLPAHPDAAFGMSYEYTVDGETAYAGIYTLTVAQLDKLIAGKLEITRTEKNEAIEKLEKMVNNINKEMGDVALTLVEKDGVYTGINVDMGQEDLMNFIMGLVMNSGYNYIGLGGEGFKYSTADGLEISLQTLINAILKDEGFNNDRLIALGEKGKGTLVTTTLQLGNSASELNYTDLAFNINLKSAPASLTGNVATLKTVSNYIKFQTVDGELKISVNLPDQVYGVYAAALVASGNVDKTDVNTLNQKVAVQFVYDYLDAILGSEADMVSFTNTMKMLGISQNLTSYNKYYTAGVNAYNEHVVVDITEAGTAIDIKAPGKQSIDALLKLSGTSAGSLGDLMGMIKEYKAGQTIDVSIDGVLKNTDKTYYALIVDAEAGGYTNKFEAPSSVDALQKEAAELAGYSAMILLDNVPGNLTVGGTTILDLNGKNVEGTITGKGNVIIIDSTMDTYKAGTVNAVAGNAKILAGNYNSDVSKYLLDGYKMDGTTVRNGMYKITDDGNTVTFTIDGKDIPDVKGLAINVATDLLLNYALSAKLTIDGNEIIGLDVNDLVGIYAGDTVKSLAAELMDDFIIGEAGYGNMAGFEALVNTIIDDLTDFATIGNALTNNEALFTHAITLAPWKFEVKHITDGNYLTANVGANDGLAKSFNFALVLDTSIDDKAGELATELGKIVTSDIEIDIPQPTFSNKTLTVGAKGKAIVDVDMSKDDRYATMIGVILAYGNSAKRQAVAAAINGGDIDALKPVVDGTSVKEIFTALKKMSRNVGFQAMAKTVGVTVDVSETAKLEALYHLTLCAAGKALDELDITGMNSKLGALYNKETGRYELSREDIFRDKELSARGYSALVELEATELSLSVKLFGEVEDHGFEFGDVNHDGKINGIDASLVLEYVAKLNPSLFCSRCANTNGDNVINGTDASLILEYVAKMRTEFPAESK